MSVIVSKGVSSKYFDGFGLSLLLSLGLGGCKKVGPNYVNPGVPVTALAPSFKEAGPSTFANAAGWTVANPSDQTLKGDWWVMFSDPQLNALEDQINPANQTLAAADANFRAARANIRFYKADLAPTLSVGPTVGAVRTSANQAYFNTTRADAGEGDFSLPLDLSYEVDLWDAYGGALPQPGKTRRRARLTLKMFASASTPSLRWTTLVCERTTRRSSCWRKPSRPINRACS